MPGVLGLLVLTGAFGTLWRLDERRHAWADEILANGCGDAIPPMPPTALYGVITTVPALLSAPAMADVPDSGADGSRVPCVCC